jgi:pseudouridine synthase
MEQQVRAGAPFQEDASMPKAGNPELKERVTLDRLFSKMGVSSRTEATTKIKAGLVTVNGKVVWDPECWVSPRHDRVRVNGQAVKARRKIYLAFYKPKGVVTSYGDPAGRPTVYDCLTGLEDWVSPVGRLDLDSTGLLLLSNDTAFCEEMTNPLSKVTKTYLVKVNFSVSGGPLAQLRQGVTLKDGYQTLPARVRILKAGPRTTHLEMVIHEGKNRQIRRMIEALGGKVLKLVRIRIGGLELGNLKIGEWRELEANDLRKLRQTGPD